MKQTATLSYWFQQGIVRNLGTSVKILLTVLFLNFIVQTGSAQTVVIDGKSKSTPTEWTQPGITHVADVFSVIGEDDIFAGNEKDFFFAVPDWHWKLGSAKDKNDIANGAAAIVNSVDTGQLGNTVTTGAPFIVFAGDRISNSGDAQIGFWFFQNGTSPVAGGDFYPEKAWPNNPPGVTRGDILVLADFTGGGRNATVIVLEFVGTGGSYPNSNGAFEQITNINAAVAENNSGTALVPDGWLFKDKNNKDNNTNTTTYGQNEFYEGYVALGAIFGNVPVCFSRFQLETRSSQSITATLDDFCGGTLGGIPTVSTQGATVCAGLSGMLTASATPPSGAPYTYAWTGPGGYSASTQNINVSVAGNYTVVATNVNGCPSNAAVATLTVNPNPTCDITGNLTVCGTSTTLTASGGGTYLWSTGATTAAINVTSTGTYSVTVTNGFGCTSSCSRNVVINTIPNCSIGGNLTICQGNSTTLTASGGGTYSWSTGASTASINVSTAGTYTVTVTSGAGCTSSCSRTVVVNPNPVCDITGNLTVCQGVSTTLTASGGTGYLWSTGATTAAINVSTAGTYTVTVTNSFGCTSTCSRTVVVNPNPVCDITGNLTICQGASTTLTASGGTGYLWSTGATTAAINVSTAGTYNVTVTSSAGCTSTCGRTVVVNQNSTANSSNPAAQCRSVSAINGTAITFGTNTFAVSGTYNFGVPATPAWTVANANGYTVNIVSPNAASTNVEVSGAAKNGGFVVLTFNVVSDRGCANSSANVTLVMNNVPIVYSLAPTNFCANASVASGSITMAGSQTGVNYTLRLDGVTYAPATPSPTQAGTGGAIQWNNLEEGNYDVLAVVVATNCQSDGPNSFVDELQPPTVTADNKEICANECVTLTGLPNGLGTWSAINNTPSGAVSGDQFCATNLAPGQYWVRHSYTNTDGCTAYYDAMVTVNNCSEALCTYTQGYFGNEGGMSCDGTNGGFTTTALINQSLGNWPGTYLKIGTATNYVQINDGDAACIIEVLPGGGAAKEVSGANQICSLPSAMLQNGRIKNVLLAQTITLALNVGIGNPIQPLGSFELKAGTLYTAEPLGGCGSDVAKPRICLYDQYGQFSGYENGYNYESRSFSQPLIDVLDAHYTKDVAGLLALAFDAIGNADGVVGSEHGISLSEIAGAAGSINEVFDECRVTVGWDIAPCPPSNNFQTPNITAGANGEARAIDQLNVAAYPNPFRDNVRFVIETPQAGQAVLEVYNIAGQKVSTLFNGHLEANESRIVDYKPTVTVNTMLIYRLRVGDKMVTGKLVGLKQ